MIKLIIFLTKIFIIAFCMLLFGACKTNFDFGEGEKGSGNRTTETRAATAKFDKIEVQQGISVEVSQAENQNIAVEIDDNIQKLILTTIENGVLKIYAKEGYNTNGSPKVLVSLPAISGLKASSGSKIDSKTVLSSTNLNVKSSSGSSIEVDVEADNLTLETSSGSTINASGKALKLDTSASSGSTINANNLLANDVHSQASSGSNTKVAAIVSLDAKASSGSSVRFSKNPKTITKDESSGGSVSGN